MTDKVSIAILVITSLAIVAGLLLSFAGRQFPANADDLIEQVNALLPQTQCAQCGYPGCRPYAAAVVRQEAEINLCPPGGQSTADNLASLLGRRELPLSSANEYTQTKRVAIIDEPLCIGCTKCRDACPVDAIVGAHQYMHTVIAVECTGCELCLPPCPVDCISLVPVA